MAGLTGVCFTACGGGDAIVVDDNHIFPGADKAACEAARDAYFSSNPDELVQGVKCVLEPADTGQPFLQEYRGTTWVDITAVIRGPKGDKGDKGDPGGREITVLDIVPYGDLNASQWGNLETGAYQVSGKGSEFANSPFDGQRLQNGVYHIRVDILNNVDPDNPYFSQECATTSQDDQSINNRKYARAGDTFQLAIDSEWDIEAYLSDISGTKLYERKVWVPEFPDTPDGRFVRIPEWITTGTKFDIEIRIFHPSDIHDNTMRGILDGRGGSKAGDAAGYLTLRADNNEWRTWYGGVQINGSAWNQANSKPGIWNTYRLEPERGDVTSNRLVKYIGNSFGLDNADTSSEDLLVNCISGYIDYVYLKDRENPTNSRFYKFAYDAPREGNTAIKNIFDPSGNTDGVMVNFPDDGKWIQVEYYD